MEMRHTVLNGISSSRASDPDHVLGGKKVAQSPLARAL